MANPSSGKSHSPISQLDDDVLWLIFTMNANMDTPLEHDVFEDRTPSSYSALDTIRKSSQVCGRWRNILLQSPSIWGQLIRIEWLDQAQDNWRDEVMKRAGNSSLCIKGIILEGYPPVRQFFSELLKTHWSRIRNIHAYIADASFFEEGLWDVFLRPAPKLETFKIIFQEFEEEHFTNQVLFSDRAPLLQQFHTTKISFSPDAPWLSQLRSLKLADCRASETTIALSNMHHLEYLDLHFRIPDTPFFPQQPIPLPYLIDLRFARSVLNLCLAFADAIKPAHSCVLALKSFSNSVADFTVDGIAIANRVLSRYSEMYFGSRRVESFSFSPRDNIFWFNSLGKSDLFPDATSFHFDIHCSFPFPPSVISSFVRSFSKCDFSNVAAFEFVPYLASDVTEQLSDFVQLVKSLPLVEAMEISECGLETLQGFHGDDRIGVVFPLLRHLKLKYMASLHGLSQFVIESFLNTRREHGVPITSFDISEYIKLEPRGWRFLDNIAGLKVLWEVDGKAMEYTCGSGSPEVLDFRDSLHNLYSRLFSL